MKIYAYIDTSAFEAAAFQANSEPLQLLIDLSKSGFLQLLDHRILQKELKARIEKRLEECIKHLKNLRDVAYIVKSVPIGPFPHVYIEYEKEDIVTHLVENISNLFRECKSKTIPPAKDTLENILGLYFSKKAPFDLEAKKHEFPDAIVIQDLLFYSKSLNEKIHVVSKDGDFERALKEHPQVTLHDSIESLLRLCYGEKIAHKTSALKLVERSKIKLQRLTSAEFLNQKISIELLDQIEVTDVTLEKISLSKITEISVKDEIGRFRFEAEFQFHMFDSECIDAPTETGGISNTHTIESQGLYTITLPCAVEVRYNKQITKILKWNKIRLNDGLPIIFPSS